MYNTYTPIESVITPYLLDIRDCQTVSISIALKAEGSIIVKEIMVIDWQMLADISYRTQLGKSLKNTLRKFDKEELFAELDDMISYFVTIDGEIKPSHRIKSLQSCSLKYDKYFPSTPVEKAFNDILGIRIIIDDYSIAEQISNANDCIRFVDMSSGKSFDDGYRAVHAYYQKDHFHYCHYYYFRHLSQIFQI